MSDLTSMQLSVLRSADRRWRTRDELAERASTYHGWSGRLEGLNQTLGSLVGRGLLERTKFGGRVHWQITDKGNAAERSYRPVPGSSS